MHMVVSIVLALTGLPALSLPNGESFEYTFDEAAPPADCTLSHWGKGAERAAGPRVAEGELRLLESQWMLSSAVAFAAPREQLSREVEVVWTMAMTEETEGAGFLWLQAPRYGSSGAAPKLDQWEAPNLAGCFGVGLDASDPPTDDPFRGSGNIYGRPEHEISLHWDGAEIVKRVSTVEFRDNEPHEFRVHVIWVAGGADIDLSIDDEPVFERFFIAAMTPYAGRPAFGAHNSERTGDVSIDDVMIECQGTLPPPEPPLTITLLDHQLNDAGHPRHPATVSFPEDTSAYARIICTLRLDRPEAGFDAWDRLASIYAWAGDGERFEILRYITPYHNGHAWSVDVTDFRPLLSGKRKTELVCGTQGKGWVVTVAFSFWPGTPDLLAYRIENLWSGQPEVGNPDKPIEEFYTPKTITLDPQTAAAKVRLVVTGHGMSPNSLNAAEFMPIGRALTVNGQTFRNTLWKTDNYLNPCRPQGGTWKYDRAGWGPGDIVRPWEVEVTHLIAPGGPLAISYRLDPYVNEDRGKTWAPYHRTESQIILYRKP